LAALSLVPKWVITVLDGTGTQGTTRGNLVAGTSADDALAAILSLAGALSNISGCVPVRIAVTYSVVISPVPPPEHVGSALNDGLFIFQTTEDDQLAIVALPGFLPSLTLDTGCFAGITINQADSDVAAFIAALSDGLFSDPFGLSLSDVQSAWLREDS